MKYNGKRGDGARALVVAVVLLTGAACSGVAPGGAALEETGRPFRSFWVRLNINNLSAEYKPVRVVVEDDDKQVGEASVYGTNQYKITLPELYAGRIVNYVAEFTKTQSEFDKDKYKYLEPLVTSLLKARYYKVPGTIPNIDGSQTVTLEITDKSVLKLGYGPNGLKLTDIPDAPLVYLIELDNTEIEAYGLVPELAIATDPSVTSVQITDVDAGYGFAAPETDWFLLLSSDFVAGMPFTFWFFLKHDTEATVTSLCPCGSCDCGPACYYELMSAAPLYLPVKVNVSTVNASGIPLATGSTINIKIQAAGLPQCPVALPINP
ncbi:MAG: hypothetical protein LBO04_02360 [Spirochaetaceae bacterium]|jgi:hypothetical protein|nr:hypothetical protein [Spirochaetaceae bacterium]